MAEKIMSYCGLICSDCSAYVATLGGDMERLGKVAEFVSRQHNKPVTAEECMCDGCPAEGRKIGYCKECAVRACAIERGVANCAHCDNYVCDKLAYLLENVLVAPDEAKANLERIRR